MHAFMWPVCVNDKNNAANDYYCRGPEAYGSDCLTVLIMVALSKRADHYIFALWFLLSIFFFSSPNLSGQRLDVCHTSTHGVALVQIYDAGLKHAACRSLKMQDAKIAICAPSHRFVGPYLRN